MLGECRPNCQPLHSSHETTQHRYCRCRPLVVIFVYYAFGTLSCVTELEKVPHFCTNYSRDWKCSPVISPDDIWALIGWHFHFGAVNATKQQDQTLWCYCAAPWRKETDQQHSDLQRHIFNMQKRTKENNTQQLGGKKKKTEKNSTWVLPICVHHGVYEAPLLSVLAMKVVLLLSLLVVAATAAPKDKRFLIKDITNWWQDVWHKAKDEFNHIVDGFHGSKCSLHGQSTGPRRTGKAVCQRK